MYNTQYFTIVHKDSIVRKMLNASIQVSKMLNTLVWYINA